MTNILSRSFQIVGSIFLMLFSLSGKRESVIRRFSSNGMIIYDSNNNILHYDKKAFKDTFRDAYITKLSFFYLILGFILDILSAETIEKGKSMILAVGICTIIIIVITWCIIKIFLKYSKNVNRDISIEELESINIEPDMVSISKVEINDLFKNY